MVELCYVGLPSVSHTDPPLGQLEPGSSVLVEDDQADRLLATGNFESPRPQKGGKSKPTAGPPDTPA